MALTPQVRGSQAGAITVTQAEIDLEVSQAGALVVAIWPAEFVENSQDGAVVITFAETTLQASQAGVMVVGKGRVQDPYLRAWSYEMDVHWKYVLRLPTGITLVYDQYAKQWYNWGSWSSTQWRPFHGTNWHGCGALMEAYGSNVVCGDDGNGSLYFLNPLSPTDDDAIFGAEVPRTFDRIVTGQMTVRGNEYHPCYGVELGGSIGANEPDYVNVTLYTSDDGGQTYDDQGTVTVDAGDWNARVDWSSGLGSYTSPGRLFRIVDDGALARIDFIEMMDGPESGNGNN